MLDLAFVRDHLAFVEQKLRERGINPDEVLKDFHAIDQERRAAITQVERLKEQRNHLTEEIARLKKAKQDASEQVDKTRQMREQLPPLEKLVEEAEARLRAILTTLPNLPNESVPLGKNEDDNKEVKRWGEPPKFDFQPKAHWELGEALGVLDLERAAKLTGARFALYWDLGAKLERALMNFMLDVHTREHGYTEVLPPYLVNSDSMFGTGQLPKFEADLFSVPTDRYEPDRHHFPIVGESVLARGQNGGFTVVEVDIPGKSAVIQFHGVAGHRIVVPWGELSYLRRFYLIPTAEVPVTNIFRDEVIEAQRLPISLTAFTPCFRSEAGSYGKDVRGIIRQHQFQKVEMVKFTRPEQSYEEHEKLTRDAEQILERLGLHYRRVLLCTGDLGFSAAKTYDLEVWLPGQHVFREISSCSNFENFQARRANIRFRTEGKKGTEFVHTLNGSGLAVGRTWVAIVENYQQADGSVKIPEVLQPYMRADRITPRKL